MADSSIVSTQDITSYFTQKTKEARKVEKVRFVERKDGTVTLELKFYDEVPRIERNIRIVVIGQGLLALCEEAEKGGKEQDKPFLELMDGLKIKEWAEEDNN